MRKRIEDFGRWIGDCAATIIVGALICAVGMVLSGQGFPPAAPKNDSAPGPSPRILEMRREAKMMAQAIEKGKRERAIREMEETDVLSRNYNPNAVHLKQRMAEANRRMAAMLSSDPNQAKPASRDELLKATFERKPEAPQQMSPHLPWLR